MKLLLVLALIPFLVDIFQDPIFSILAVIGAFGVGLFQGIILGRAILVRFPRLQNHLKTVSLTLFVLFLANAILSVPRFASPEKIELSNLSAGSPAEFASVLFLIFGMNTGFLTVLAISVTVMTFVILKFTNLNGIVKLFVFFFSSLLLIFTGISRFTDLTPSTFEVLLYFLYQLGITIGILGGTIRKIKPKKLDLE
ncbi:hypothetical protein AAA799E16_00603 [Marine Group I thaumarchaeote SCGC AAA799-E16]|uniref:Uncharacterized protein n=4 Tax=Marine Group I TaxID=905826 RepID=A0A081RL84_9ARCH|nr:hypothetical protein AAA799N04_01637 [Marine Group I thaumarchaeote SCGC AAA799-N04]KER06686.1 hypothetical protein AAA799E16_00603 [Marine Group I thaumarchaeote SCGC AAA799-E16]KFM16163.1 hypothetical protein AAA799D11_00967 [Marine Group I thaumarchaeote SCGC AAA799-D11]KFM17900.1 hypothetical protein SCCGRSA3_01845 [Marine Group I thaumarchaeote SCGC RSA3]